MTWSRGEALVTWTKMVMTQISQKAGDSADGFADRVIVGAGGVYKTEAKYCTQGFCLSK